MHWSSFSGIHVCNAVCLRSHQSGHLFVSASNSATLLVTNVDAANKAKVAASGDVTLASGENRTTQVGSDVKSGTVGISAAKPTDKESKDSSIQTRAATTQLQSEGDILSQSGGNTKLQGTQVKAQNFTVNAGVGAAADPNAKVVIEGVRETLQTSHTEKARA